MDSQDPEENYRPSEYKDEKELPFGPEGNLMHLDPEGKILKVQANPNTGYSGLAACKTILVQPKNGVTLPTAKYLCQKEANILNAARHGHVINIIATYFLDLSDYSLFSIIMDRADSNLSKHLKPRGEPCIWWLGCLIGVVRYLHDRGIRHRDIKPQNILIKDKNILLADFGISQMGLGKTLQTTMPMLTKARTPTYCAPEVDVEKGMTRGRSADIFSLGAVTLEILLAHSYEDEYRKLEEILGPHSGRTPFGEKIDKVQGLIQDVKGRVKARWHGEMLSLCQKMLDTEREHRPSAEELDLQWSRLKELNPRLQCSTCPEAAPKTKTNDLIGACSSGFSEKVKRLLGEGANAGSKGAIHQASAAGRWEIVRLLLDHVQGANINKPDYAGQTALHYAAAQKHEEVVKLLLAYNANSNGATHSADIGAEDVEGRTALHYAAGSGSKQITEMLLKNRVPIDKQDADGRTALHFAARRGTVGVVEILIQYGAKTNLEDKSGWTALGMAESKGFRDVTKLLKTKSGDNGMYSRLLARFAKGKTPPRLQPR